MLNFKAINIEEIHLEGISWVSTENEDKIDGIIIKINDLNFQNLETYIKKSTGPRAAQASFENEQLQ